MVKLGRELLCLALCVGLLISGCAQAAPQLGKWEGPTAVASAQKADWTYNEEKAAVLQSPHYRVYTTVDDDEVLDRLSQVMEGALSMYTEVAGIQATDRPLDCYIFRWRSEWDQYTIRYTGQDADIYRQIRSGGYAVRDRYVAYYIGKSGTFSVAAHEGWHQFAGRYFKGRMPPFVEEGIACMFETITWSDRLPRWNLSVNVLRAQTLKKAMDNNNLWPLEKLVAMHAGDIVGESGERIDAFYAQAWAFARFLWEGDNGAHRPAMQKWLSETAAGTVWDPTHSHSRATAPWNRRAVRPMVEHYLGMEMPEIDRAFATYMKKIANEELPAQWRS